MDANISPQSQAGPPARNALATLCQQLRFGAHGVAVTRVLCAVYPALASALKVTDGIASRLVRLPKRVGLEAKQGSLIETLTRALQAIPR